MKASCVNEIKKFSKLNQCLEYLENNKQLSVFAEDINNQMAKCFLATDPNTIYLLSRKKKSHFYEYFNDAEKLKLFLDIDVKNSDNIDTFNNILDTSIKCVTDELEKYGINSPKVIVLHANRPNKMSAHVIFQDVVFENIKLMKFFMTTLESDLIDKKIIDLNPYRRGCFRMLWNSKKGIDVNLEFYKSKNYKYSSEKQLFMDCILRNLPDKYQLVDIKIPENITVVDKEKPMSIRHMNMNAPYAKQPVSILEKYVGILNIERANNYNSWLKIGMVLHNCNHSAESFELWDKWSQNSDSYVSRNYNIYKWNSFKFGHYSIGTLKYFAKKDNSTQYSDIEYSLEKPFFESLKFSSPFLFEKEDETIHSLNSFISKYIIDWFTGDVKTLAIKSPYGTGKTRLIHKIISEYNINKVLFVSYRQTLTNELYGCFKDFKVASYLDKDYTAKKIICQLDSLPKLLNGYTFIGGHDIAIPSYDLVILDEIESLLYHFRSSTIENKEYVFDLLQAIIFNSKKVLALDGDLHNRAVNYINSFGKSIIVENTIKKNPMHFVFTDNRDDFEDIIDNDLKEGKNISVVCMPSGIATHFNEKYKDTYKTVLHCSGSGDNTKEQLKNVSKFWKQFQLVLYSPSIESGVNMDVEHFDNIKGVLSTQSTSPRGFMQMCSRIRTLKNNTVLVYLNGMPPFEYANFYTFDEIKDYVADVYGKYLKPKFILDKQQNKYVISYEYGLYHQTLIYNEQENANKHKYLFLPYLLQLIKQKGHTYAFNIKNIKTGIKSIDFSKEELFKASDISSQQYENLLIKQASCNATREDKLCIQKYLFKKIWNVDDTSLEFIQKYYDLSGTLYNLRFLLKQTEKDPYIRSCDGAFIINYDRAVVLLQVSFINDILIGLGFGVLPSNVVLKKEDFDKKIKEVVMTSKVFVDTNTSKLLFKFHKVDPLDFNACSVVTIVHFFNKLFKPWGFYIHSKQKSVYANSKCSKTSIYSIKYLENIDSYI
jgi:hypothetical protein